MKKTSVYALIGDPVAHSLSPAIYNTLFDHFGLNCEYILLRIEKGYLGILQGLIEQNELKGYSVTMPHKEDILKELDILTPRASIMQSVNHVYRENGKWTGDSVDGAGVVRAIKAAGQTLFEKNALVLGYGGAAKSAAYYLSQEVTSLAISGRDPDKAKAASDAMKGHAKCFVDAKSMGSLRKTFINYALIVNATPLGMEGYDGFNSLDWLASLSKGSIVCDLVYDPVETKLIAAARRNGLITITGIDVLTYQAYEQFNSWTGRNVDADADEAVRDVLRKLGVHSILKDR